MSDACFLSRKKRPARQSHDPVHTDNEENRMLYYAVIFFIVAIVAAVLGFGGIAAGAASIAKILFVVFLILAVLSLVKGMGKK